MKRRYVVIAGVVVVVVAGGIGTTAAVRQSGDDSTRRSPSAPAATAPITRGDLVATETEDGTLGYADTQTLLGGASGVVTWLPAVGSTVRRGHTLYDLNQEPVTLMYGGVPIYRTLSDGVSDGDDVKELERNLHALGYGPGMTVDDEFTSETTDAVEAWQDDRGLPETGVIDGSQVIFADGAVRITDREADKGGRSAAGRPVLKVTSTDRQVKVNLDTANQQLARKGEKVTVELPDNSTVDGKITKVGTVASKSGDSGSSDDSSDSTIEVDISLAHPEKAGRLDQAPVSVEMRSESRENVLSVPVEALLARPNGGYAVQLAQGKSVRQVPVTTGLYASGRVEISGPGLAEGMRVGVPSK